LPVIPPSSEYSYVVRGRILVERAIQETGEEDRSPAEFTVTLRGPAGESAALEQGSFEPGVPTVWTGAEQLMLVTEDEYDEVCLRFERDIKDLFPRTTQSGSQVCLPVVER